VWAVRKSVRDEAPADRVFVVLTDGSQCTWGRVASWEPPHRIVSACQRTASWQFDPDLLTEVEVRFVAEGQDQTRAEFEHRNLDRFGDARDDIRRSFDAPGGGRAS